MRVAGTDPGTSSLDLLILDDGLVADQVRFQPSELQTDPEAPVKWLRERGPFSLIAGPSGYGLPLVHAADCTDRHLALMSLVRPDERGKQQGVAGFSAVARAFRDSGLPVVFLPGVIHLPTIPDYRKFNRIDLGTPDKLCVVALASTQTPSRNFCVVELGSAFSACLLVAEDQIIDGMGGTSGPIGWSGGGFWDGELAYLLSPLSKRDLFQGGARHSPSEDGGWLWYLESIQKAISALYSVAHFDVVMVSGKMLEDHAPRIMEALEGALPDLEFRRVTNLPEAWVKHAAQGSALIADGLAGGRFAGLVDRLQLRTASGNVFDWIVHPRADQVRALFER